MSDDEYGEDQDMDVFSPKDFEYSDITEYKDLLSKNIILIPFEIKCNDNYVDKLYDNFIPNEIMSEIIWYAIHMIPRYDRPNWWKNLFLVSKDFTKCLLKINDKVELLFEWDKLLFDNYESSYRLKECSELEMYMNNLSIDIKNFWFPNGIWTKAFDIQNEDKGITMFKDISNITNIKDLEIALKYKEFSKDIGPLIGSTLSNIFNSHTNYKNFKFMIKKSDIDLLNKTYVKKDDINYNKYFWLGFISLEDSNIRKWSDFIMDYDDREYDPNTRLINIGKVFKKHFKNYFVYENVDTSSEYWGLYFFIGETIDYYMGFWFVAERDS